MALTRTQRIEEIVKCGADPAHFIKTYVYIQHPIRGRILFKTYDFQDDVVTSIAKHRFNIVLKSRQLGLSTIAAAYAVWYAIFNKDKNVLIIATKLETAMNFIKKVKIALRGLPDWLLLPTYDANKRSVTFSNGSQITAVPTAEDAGRSEALSLLIVDEAAFIRGFEDIWTGLYPTISTGGSALILSTPNGVGGMYYKLWMNAQAGENEFNCIELPWWVHPEHDEAWLAKETRNMSKRKVAQEYLCNFLASGDTFLNVDDLSYLNEQVRPPSRKDGHVWIWGEPVPDKKYVISADVARGDAHDFSTFHVTCVEDMEVVAEYMGKIPPEKFALVLDEWGRLYNEALICPENNSFGYHTCVTLRDGVAGKTQPYPRLWYKQNRGELFDYFVPPEESLPGFSTQGASRQLITTKLEEVIRNKRLRIYSKRTYEQMQAFIWKGNKPQAQADSHDDLILSLAITAWLIGDNSAVNGAQHAMAMAMLAATSRESNDKSCINSIHEVVPLVDPNLRVGVPQPPQSPAQQRRGSSTDFSWLLR
jgi:hypothetical protein